MVDLPLDTSQESVFPLGAHLRTVLSRTSEEEVEEENLVALLAEGNHGSWDVVLELVLVAHVGTETVDIGLAKVDSAIVGA